MGSTILATAALAAALTLTGCLTPAMGRRADELIGGSPSPNPISVRDVETSRLVGLRFDGTPVDRPLDYEQPSLVRPQPARLPLRP